MEWLEKRVARFKIPKFFHQIEELPRNGSGKILKRILVEQFVVTWTKLPRNRPRCQRQAKIPRKAICQP